MKVYSSKRLAALSISKGRAVVRLTISLALVIGGGAFLFSIQHAHAATTYTVNTLADTDDTTCDAANCTLREAINAANRNPGLDIINFSVNGIITTQDGFGILEEVTINGPGSNLLTVSGNDTGVLFVVETPGIVTFSQLTISHGKGDFSGSGGGISNRAGGTVNVNNCTLTNNSTTSDGGAIFNSSGTLNVTNSILSNNTSASRGAGIYNEGALNVTNSTLSNNSAAIQGGGIFNLGTATVDSSTISGNSAPGQRQVQAQGGGIYNQGTLDVIASTVSNNSADSGGGISNFNGTANVTNSTLSGNSANRGGAIFAFFLSATTNVTSSTLSNNSAATQGGGIFNDTFANSNLHSSIVALNTAPSGSDLFSGPASAFNSQGYNAIGTTTDSNFVPTIGDQVGVTATQLNLGPLANNGGLTQTRALGTGSVAIDTGDDAVILLPLSLTTDQRGLGYARKSGTHVDIGAFELQQRNAPTNANQCKNGGWRNFDNPRTFKNQGDCIQYVNTGH